MAGWTGLEPATSGVTGQRCNQLYYHPARVKMYARVKKGLQEEEGKNFNFRKDRLQFSSYCGAIGHYF